MPAIRYVTSDNFGAPGLYIQEREPSPVVRGINRSAIAMVGTAVRGPVGRGITIDSPRRFEEVFGGRDQGSGGAIASELWKALLGKPFGRLIVFRAAAAAAVAASFTLETTAGGAGTAVVRIDAANVGAWGNNVGWKVSAATDGNANHWNLQIRYLGRVYLFENLDTSSTNDNLAATLGSDDGNLVVLTKLAAGRPANSAGGVDGADTDGYTLLGQTVAGYTSVVGADGSIADTDFTGSGKAMELANAVSAEVAACLVIGRSNSVIRAKAYALAPTCRAAWLICPDSASTTRSAWATEVALYRHERIWPVFRYAYLRDTTDELIATEPHAWFASTLSQIDEDAHPGAAEFNKYLAGIVSLAFPEFTQDDLDAIDAIGSSVLERRIGTSGGYEWGWACARTADLAVNNRHVDQRRMKDYLMRGLAARVLADVFQPNTASRREATKSTIVGWLEGLARSERFVDVDEDTKRPQFSVQNGTEVNSKADRKAGIQRTAVVIQTISKQLIVKLDVQVGPDATVQVVEA